MLSTLWINRYQFALGLAFAHQSCALMAQEPAPKPEPAKTESAQATDTAKASVEKAAPAPAKTPEELKAAAELDQKIIDEGKANNEIMKNLQHLCYVIGPRLTGSPALKTANDWSADKFKEYGLTNVHLESWTIPASWERGVAKMEMVSPQNGQTLTVAAGGWTGSTKGKVEGPVIFLKDVRNLTDLDKYRGKLKNAVVMRSAPSTIRPISEMSMFGGGPAAGGRRGGGDGQAAGKAASKDASAKADTKGQPTEEAKRAFARKRQGGGGGDIERGFREAMEARRAITAALAAEGVAAILTDSGKPHGLLNMSGSWRGTDRVEAGEPIPTLYMVHEHYEMLYKLATTEGVNPRVSLEVSNKFTPGPVPVYNTIAEIRGTEKPEEVVICGAHIDSWDLAQGATDNGTGTTVTLEAARIIGKLGIKPKRTIRFILFSGEEQGLFGSKAYVDQHKSEMDKVSACVVHDTGTGKIIGVGLQGFRDVKPIFDSELTSLKSVGGVDINMRGLGATDHASFAAVGVPGFAFQQDPAEYRFTHHSQSDTLDKARPDDLIQGAQVMAIIAVRVANLPNMLPRTRDQ